MKATEFLRKRIVPNLPYLLMFWGFAKLGEAYRTADGADLPGKLNNIISTLNIAFKNPMLSVNFFDLAVGAAGTAIIYAAVYSKKKKAKKYRNDIEYGSARWGEAADIKPFADKNLDNNIILTTTESLTMNPRPSNPKYARNKNMLVIGGSGSGKTRFMLKPNLMQCVSKDYPVSFVITDPKGEILQSCGKMLQKHGYKIKIFNTVNFNKSQHYNPFSYIHSEKDILKLVTALIANTKNQNNKGGDDFWEKAEILLFTALIAYLHYEDEPQERNFSSLAEMIASMEVREEDDEFKNIVDLLFDELESVKPDCFAVRQYKKFKLSAGKTAKSILISCGARLASFDISEIREITKYDELELDKLGDRKTALFLIISDTDDSYNFLVSMCYT